MKNIVLLLDTCHLSSTCHSCMHLIMIKSRSLHYHMRGQTPPTLIWRDTVKHQWVRILLECLFFFFIILLLYVSWFFWWWHVNYELTWSWSSIRALFFPRYNSRMGRYKHFWVACDTYWVPCLDRTKWTWWKRRINMIMSNSNNLFHSSIPWWYQSHTLYLSCNIWWGWGGSIFFILRLLYVSFLVLTVECELWINMITSGSNKLSFQGFVDITSHTFKP